MKAFALIQKDTDRINQKDVAQTTVIKGEEIHYTVTEMEEPHFDPLIHCNHVLVKKMAFSCNYRDNTYMVLNQRKLNGMPFSSQNKCAIGSEFSGTVLEVGSQVTRFKKGDRVIGNGQYPFTYKKDVLPGLPTTQASAQLEIFREEKLLKMPDNMPFEVGAAFTIGAQTTYAMIKRLQIQENKAVLITGLNSNTSLFALQALQQYNIRICGLVRNPAYLSVFSDTGLDVDQIFVIEDQIDSLMQNELVKAYVEEKGGFDYIIDPFSDHYFLKVFDLLNFNGKYITCGVSNTLFLEKKEVPLNQLFAKLIVKNITVIGNCLGATEDLERALEDYSNGNLEVLLGGVYSGTETTEFFERTFLKNNSIGKVVYKYE
jgi:NADPH:quinone reductase-like Zn-dependent oxidoreductase